MARNRALLRLTMAASVLLVLSTAAQAATIVVFCSNGYRAVMQDLIFEFQRTTASTVAVTYDLSTVLARRIDAGEPFDVAILTPALIADLEGRNVVRRGTAVPLAVTPIGLAVKAGSGRPDLHSTDAVRQTLAGARSIAYAREGAAAGFFLTLLERLDMAAALKPRVQALTSGAAVADAVARGGVQFGVIPVSEILPVSTIAVGGTFPPQMGGSVIMMSGLGRSSADAARTLIAFLTGAGALPALQRHGMQRP